MPAVYRIYQGLWRGLDWVFPPYCAGCNVKGERWCAQCRAACRRAEGSLCKICGRTWNRDGVCDACASHEPNFTAARAWGVHEDPLRQAVHRLKYYRDMGLGEALALDLLAVLQEQDWPVELVVPMALGVQRRRERGYNQAALLAYPLALSAELSYSRRALRRTRETAAQVGLSQRERLENVAGAFEADVGIVKGKRVLLVDDVMMTGATLDSAAWALRQAGAAQVFAITLSRAGSLGAA